MKFELHKRYTVKMPVGAISEAGIKALKKFMNEQVASDWPHKSEKKLKYLPALPDSWAWVWVVNGKADYVGTFPKRVSKHYYKEYGVKCPSEFLQALGNIARQHSHDVDSYQIDFTNDFSWNSGDFGDRNSCFWGGRSNARQLLVDNGGHAVRLWRGNEGYGRAWLYPLKSGLWCVFNGYGLSVGTIGFARILGQFWGASYKKVTLTNNRHGGGTIYINASRGFVVGAADMVGNKKSVDLGIKSGLDCEHCGDDDVDDNCYYAPDGERLCEDCFYEQCVHCADCSESAWRDDSYYIEDHGDVCEDCYNRGGYGYCEPCGMDHHPDDMYVIDECELVCDRCYSRGDYGRCKKCEKHFSQASKVINEDGHCEDCR